MARELFEAVQTAENNADQRIQDAQKEARELLKETQAAIAANERAVTLEHRAMYQSILDAKRTEILAHIEAERPEREKAQAAEIAGARERLASAAQRIFERIWHDGDR